MPIQKQEVLGYGVVRFFPSRSASRGAQSALHKMNQEHLLVCSGPQIVQKQPRADQERQVWSQWATAH